MSPGKSQQQQQSPQESTPAQPVESGTPAPTDVKLEEMGIAEMMRVMDVATTLRQEQELVKREFDVDQTKQMLREKLKRTADMTGESLTSEQIEAAVNWYYDNLHEYQEPEKSLQWYLAHMYIRRTAILTVLGTAAMIFLGIWGLWFAPFAPLSEANQLARKQEVRTERLEDVQMRFGKDLESVSVISESEALNEQLAKLKSESETHFANKDLDKLSETEKRLQEIMQRANEEFALAVVAGEKNRSAFERNFEDASGKRLSGYYLVVQAKGDDGKILTRTILNVEDDKSYSVKRWAERVPKSVYDRLKKDKQEDGVLNETAFGKKERGKLKVEIIMTDQNNLPITRSAQITNW